MSRKFTFAFLLSLSIVIAGIEGVSFFDELTPQNVSTAWNEDIEPQLSSYLKRFRREAHPLLQEFLYDDQIDSQCIQNYARILSGMQNYELWALKFLDSSGSFVPNIAEGHMASFGSYDECLSIQAPRRSGDDKDEIMFSGKYCSVSVRVTRQPMLYRVLQNVLNSDPLLRVYLGNNASVLLEAAENTPFGVRTGICMPSGCNEDFVPHIARKLGGKYGISADVLACATNGETKDLPRGTYISVAVLGLISAVIGLATWVDCFPPEGKSQLTQWLRCFSLKANYTILTTTTVSKTSPTAKGENSYLDCIHGIRVFSSFWILFAHSYSGDPSKYDRPYHILTSLQSPAFSVVTQGVLAVETFFCLTGILLYKSIQSQRKEQPNVNVFVFVLVLLLRRAYRLMIPAMGTLFLFYILPLLTSGPLMDILYTKFLVPQCDTKWWSIPLFLNNFWNIDDNCLPHLWYLAVDMHTLCICILPAILITTNARKGISLVSLLTFISMLYTGIIIYYYGAAPTILILPNHLRQVLRFGKYLHTAALPHLSTVCVGLIGGYLIEHHRENKMKRIYFSLGWILFALLSIGLIFAVYPWHKSGFSGGFDSLMYGVMFRPLWAACIVWIVYACAAGGGEPVRWLLNRPNFVILGRLSCCFYMVTLLVLLIKEFQTRTSTPFTYYNHFRSFFADMIISYGAAFLLFVFFEGPAFASDKLFMSILKRKQGEPTKKTNNIKAFHTKV